MAINFLDLVTLYRKVDFQGSAEAEYCIENNAMLSLIENLTSSDNYILTRISLLGGNLQIGETVKLEITQPKVSIGWLYNSIDDFVEGDFLRTLPHNESSKKPYYIKSIDYYSEDDNNPNLITAYKAIQKLLCRLESMSAYLDRNKFRIIFVAKQTFELHYDISKDLASFELLLEKCSKDLDGKVKIINDFCGWLDDGDTGKHLDVKKSILAVLLSDIQTPLKTFDIMDVVENIEFLYTSARGQLSIYLEDFKYEKFVQKLEENSEKFISRINDSVSKVLSQILALPIAAAAPVILKGRDSSSEVIIYIALLVYAVICYFALSTQKSVLNNLRDEVSDFDKQGKLPESLKERWDKEKVKISSLMDKQTHLYLTMNAVIYIAVVYSLYNISRSMPVFWSVILFILVIILSIATYIKIKPKAPDPI